jgi:hypothetical protein
MGRDDGVYEPDAAIQFNLYRLEIKQGYDAGGAYWGDGSYKTGVMYRAYGDGPEWRNEMFVRATSREEAKKQVLAKFKNATFYR